MNEKDKMDLDSLIVTQLLNSQFCTNFLSAVCASPLVYIPTAHFSIIEKFLQEGLRKNSKLESVLGIKAENVSVVDLQNTCLIPLTKLGDDKEVTYEDEETKEGVIKSIRGRKEEGYKDCCIFIIKNISSFGDEKEEEKSFDTILIQYLHQIADLYERGYYERQKKPLCILFLDPAPPSQLPQSLIDFFTIVDFPLPKIEDIRNIVSALPISLQYSQTEKDAIRDELTRNLLGLSYQDVSSVIKRLQHFSENLTKASIQFALEEKKRIISKSGLIQIIDTDVDIEDVGGLDNLKTDLRAAKKLFAGLNIISQENVNLPYPKGILIVGMPGCGKSLIAKAIANAFSTSSIHNTQG